MSFTLKLKIWYACLGDDEDMLSVRLYHGGKLRMIPRAEYVGGELSIYDFHGIQKLTFDDIGDKVRALGYSGFKDLYFRVPTKSLETGLVPLKNEGDMILMLSYAQENNYRCDIYVKHFNDQEDDDRELTDKDYENICPEDYERRGSNQVINLDEEDEEWCAWSDSDYAMSDDDALFDQNVDAGAEWIGKIRHHLGLSDADDSGEEEDDECGDNGDASDCDSLDSLFEDLYGDSGTGMSKIPGAVASSLIPPSPSSSEVARSSMEKRKPGMIDYVFLELDSLPKRLRPSLVAVQVLGSFRSDVPLIF
ncbi:hypothetical protein ACET3Z_018527 [Daucus carota]